MIHKITFEIPDMVKYFPKDAENDYCPYVGECTIGCRECKYFEQKGRAENEDSN